MKSVHGMTKRTSLIVAGLLLLAAVVACWFAYADTATTRLTVEQYADSWCTTDAEKASREVTTRTLSLAGAILWSAQNQSEWLDAHAPPEEFAEWHEWYRRYSDAMLAWLEPNAPDPPDPEAFDAAFVVAREDPSNPMGAWFTSDHVHPMESLNPDALAALVKYECIEPEMADALVG